MSLLFSAVSLAGLGLTLYATLANRKRAESEGAVLGFSESTEQDQGILDLDTGHEGLKHSEKEPFDPEKHKSEPL
jgi:hypothetical protein